MGDIITQPGVYTIDAEAYHADPVPSGSLSASGAKLILPPSSPANYRAQLDNPRPPTQAMELGTAAHMRILGEGPEIHVVKAKRWDTDAVKAEVKAARDSGVIPLKPDAAQSVEDMAAALRQHKTARMLLQPGSGLPEQSIFWEDKQWGIWRRARPDWLPHGTNGLTIIPDYKTAGKSIHPSVFSKTITDLGYHIQAAQYCAAVEAIRPGTETWFVWIVQETFPPYQVACYWAKSGPGTISEPGADPDVYATGQTLMQAAMEIYRDCTEAENRGCTPAEAWPGHQPEQNIQPIHLPRWAPRSVDND